MSVKLADTLAPMGEFPIGEAKDIDIEINGANKRLQQAYEDGDLGGGGSSIQVEELPIASSEESGKIYQYIGVSGTYTKGFFYECKNYGYLCWTIDDSSYYTKSTETKADENVYVKNGDLYEEVGVIVEIINDTLTFEDDNENEITLGRYSDGDITNVGYEWTSINVEDGTTVVDEVARERAYEALELAETKLTKVSTIPTVAEQGEIYLYVGETINNFKKGHIYQVVGGVGVNSALKFTCEGSTYYVNEDNMILNFDTEPTPITQESKSTIKGIPNQNEYYLSFEEGVGLKANQVDYHSFEKTVNVSLDFSQSSPFELGVKYGDVELPIISDLYLITYESENIIWLDITPKENSVEEVDSLPQTLEKKVYNVTNSTVYYGGSCSEAMSDLQSNFSKNISVLYKKTTSDDVIREEWRYNVLSGTLTYDDDVITKVIVVREDETISYLYNGDTEVEYLSDDFMSFYLTYAIDQVYSKNIKLATTTDLPTIDQNYNADSPNPQSGVAVASAVSSATADCVKTSGNQEINGIKTFNNGIRTDKITSTDTDGQQGSIDLHTGSYLGSVTIEGPGDNSDATMRVVGGNNNESYIEMLANLIKVNNKNVVTSVNSTQANDSGNVSVDVGVTSVNGNTGAVTLSIPTITVDGNTATITY